MSSSQPDTVGDRVSGRLHHLSRAWRWVPRVAEQAGFGTASQEPSPSPEVIFDVLKNQRRRQTLAYLDEFETNSEVAVSDLATEVAAREQGCEPGALTSAERKRVYVALQQSHLPKLAEVGFIDYEAERGHVALREEATVCRVYLEILRGREFPWSEYYLALGVVCTALVVSLWSGAVPAGGISGWGWAGLLTTLFTLSALLHVRLQRRQRLVDFTD